MSPEPVAGFLGTAVLMFLIAVVLLVVLIRRTTVILRAIPDENQQDLLVNLGKELRESNQSLHRRLVDADQGLRAAVSNGIRSGLVETFAQVQAGMTAQGDALAKMTEMLNQRLSAAETAAADGRAKLLGDMSDATRKTGEDVGKMLKMFGDQQSEGLIQIAKVVKEGNEAANSQLVEFRREVTERLDVVGKASTELLANANTVFADILKAVGAAEQRTREALVDQHVNVLERLAQGQTAVSEKLGKDLGDLTNQIRESLDAFAKRLREEQEMLRGLVGSKLDEMRSGNEAKLEDMRKAVDEKLQSALEKQVGESFARVAEQFAAVQQAIGQVQSVAGQVGDLKRLFSNVKARGGWGEAQVEAMLQDMLSVGTYEKNFRVRDDTQELVEFAIRIPVRGGEDTWLALDSKFPTEDYDRLLNANEAGDRDAESKARSALERRITEEAERIASKYVYPPRTVEFAILYLPSDSLFAEIARCPGLIERVRRSKVMVMGPTLLPAFLHTVKVGYLTVALEKNVAVIGETLAAVKTEWNKLESFLAKLSRRTDSFKKAIDDTRQRARAVGRKLTTVDVIEAARAEAVLGIEGSTFADEDLDVLPPEGEPAEED